MVELKKLTYMYLYACAGVLSDVLNYVLEPSNVIQRETSQDATADDSKLTVGTPNPPLVFHL